MLRLHRTQNVPRRALHAGQLEGLPRLRKGEELPAPVFRSLQLIQARCPFRLVRNARASEQCAELNSETRVLDAPRTPENLAAEFGLQNRTRLVGQEQGQVGGSVFAPQSPKGFRVSRALPRQFKLARAPCENLFMEMDLCFDPHMTEMPGGSECREL